MRVRRDDDAAISEVVGALMLVLIVTSAASAFAVFSAKQRERTEAQKELEQTRALEKLEILSVAPTPNAPETEWTDLDVTVLSQHTNPSEIIGIDINGVALAQFLLKRSDGSSDLIDFFAVPPETAPIEARERFHVVVNLAADGTDAIAAPVDASIEVSLQTARFRTFERSFIPPTAAALVDVKSVAAGGGTFNDFAILDASQSDAADPSTRIVKWQWTLDRIVSGITTLDGDPVVTAAEPAFVPEDLLRFVSGPGIPAGAQITLVNSDTSVEITPAPTADGTIELTIHAVSTPLGRMVKSFQCPSDTGSSNTAYGIDLKIVDNYGLFSRDRVQPDPFTC